MRSLLLAGCLTLLVAAPAPAIEEHKDLKGYGNCAVTTQVDLLTDEESPSFLCAEFPDITKSFGITKVPNHPFIISLRAGIQFHPSDSIPIAIRVYPGPVIRREARWIEDAAYLVDSQLAESLLYQIIDAQTLVIEVGTQRATIDLAGSAQAVRDFRMRLSTSQQSLDIPSSPWVPKQQLLPPQWAASQIRESPPSGHERKKNTTKTPRKDPKEYAKISQNSFGMSRVSRAVG